MESDSDVKSQSFLDRLSPDERAAVKKTSSQRLCARLSKVGYSEETLEVMNRDELLEAWAKVVIEGADGQMEGASRDTGKTFAPPFGYDPDLERMRIQLEQQRFEADLNLRKQQFEREQEIKTQ